MACCLQPLDYWDRGFESRWEYDCLSLVFVVYCVGSGLCVELITHSDESYQVYLLRIVCDIETSSVRRPTPESGCCSTERNCALLLLNLQYLLHCHITRYISSSFAHLETVLIPSTALLSPEKRVHLALKALVFYPPPIGWVESTGICGPVYCLYLAWESLPAYVTFQEFKGPWRCHMDSFVRRETHKLTFAEGCT